VLVRLWNIVLGGYRRPVETHEVASASTEMNSNESLPTSGRGATCKSCAHCPWMAMNRLEPLAESLRTGNNEIVLPRELCDRAAAPIKRLLDFAAERDQLIYGNNDA
jgi:quinolinate synthase